VQILDLCIRAQSIASICAFLSCCGTRSSLGLASIFFFLWLVVQKSPILKWSAGEFPSPQTEGNFSLAGPLTIKNYFFVVGGRNFSLLTLSTNFFAEINQHHPASKPATANGF